MPSHQSRFRQKILRFIVEILLVAVVVYIPTRRSTSHSELTESTLSYLLDSIHEFAESHDALPGSLKDLFEFEDSHTLITDAWNNPIHYQVSDGGLLILSSYGADGIPGGTDKHLDIVWIYKTRTSEGQFVAGGELWMTCLEIQGPSRSISLDSQLPDYCADYQ